MADLQLAIRYNTALSQHGATIMWALWPIWALLAPLIILATIAAVSISPIIFPPAVTLLLLSISSLVFIAGISLTLLFEDNQILLNSEYFCLPIHLASPFLRNRRLRWSELSAADIYQSPKDSNHHRLMLSFNSGAAIGLELKNIANVELEQLLMATELWGRSCKLSEQLIEFQRHLQNENKGIEKVSYTRLWEDELNRRFRTTTFVPLEPGTVLQNGRIVISRQLAFGGLSAIYLAKKNAKDFVAVKEASTPADADPELKRQAEGAFKREAELLMKLEHKQIARVFDHFVENDRNYLVLEHIQGQNLRQFIQQNGPQTEVTVLSWAIQIASILEYLHERPTPIVHRDLSPENIMIRPDGTLILIDFGAANEFIGQATGTLVGKQSYMPPEQLRGKATIKSDYYALGATMYFLLTGQDPPAISVLHPKEKVNIDSELDTLVSSLTALESSDRVMPATATLVQIIAKRGC